jgi:hypothetical protein
VKSPAGTDIVGPALERAKRGKLPNCGEGFSDPKQKLLVKLCWELQKFTAPRPFWLSCDEVERRLGVPRKQANRWLLIMRKRGILKEAERPVGLALRYRFTGEV